MKNYNKDALRGYDYTDEQWQQDMAKVNVMIPDNLLHTVEAPKYVIEQNRKKAIEHYISEGDSENVARNKAMENAKAATKSYKELLNKSAR